MKEVWPNVMRGIAIGLLLATAFSIWAWLLRLAQGDPPFARTGISFWTTILFYYAGFSAGGLLAGILWVPLHRVAIGWFVMGVVFLLPVYAFFLLLNREPDEQNWVWHIGATLVGAILVGGLVGVRTWSLNRTGFREPRTNWRFVLAVVVVGTVLAVSMYMAWW